MIYATASNSRPPSHPPSHFQPSVDPQQPWSYIRPDTRFDAPRRSMALPNSNPSFASHPQVPQVQDHTSPHHLPFTTEGGNRSQNFSVYDATPPYLSDYPHAVSARETPALYQPSFPPCNAHPTFPSAGPSSFGGGQPTLLSWNNGTAQLGPAMAAPVLASASAPPPPTSLPLQPFNSHPRALGHFPTAPTTQAQAIDVPNVNVNSRSYPPGRRTRALSRTRGPRTRGLRTVPLVRIEDEVVWVRPHVLKVTLWLNWSPNADAQAHEPWDL